MKNGLFLGTYALKTVSLGAIVAFLLVIGGFKVLKIKMTKKDMLCDIVVSLNGKEIETKAMIDSGNLLREPITNTPVIILEHTLLYKCMPKEILNNLEKIIRRGCSGYTWKHKIRIYSKIKADSFFITGETEWDVDRNKSPKVKDKEGRKRNK